LKASICDGRGREQKARLLGTLPRHRIMYLIEGNMDKPASYKVNGLPITTLFGSMINTQFRDGIKVYKTTSLSESALYLVKLYDKLTKECDNYFCDDESKTVEASYSATLKKSKKANMTPDVWFINLLSLIPQVTEKISEVVIQKYSSMRELCDAYANTPEHLRPKLLSDVTYQLKTGKSRRIGDKISERVYKFVYNIQ